MTFKLPCEKGLRRIPFTFAHPLYAAPLKLLKPKYFSLTGIILGSMAPDFEYFMALEPYQIIGHTAKGLFIQAIPLSLLLAFVFHRLIKVPLTHNLPSLFNMDKKSNGIIQDWNLPTVRSWIIFIVSVMIGFYSHVLLDGFTHKSGYFVMRNSLLQEYIIGIPIFKILQHSLSLVGLILELTILLLLLRKTQVDHRYIRVQGRLKIKYWFTVLLVTILTLTLKFLLSSSTNYMGMLVVSSISGFFLGLLVASIIYRIRVLYKRELPKPI